MRPWRDDCDLRPNLLKLLHLHSKWRLRDVQPAGGARRNQRTRLRAARRFVPSLISIHTGA